MTHDLYLTADEAATLLGVTRSTLYAYVSRKKLRSFETPGDRARRYWRPDVMALAAGEKPEMARAGERQTAITFLTEQGTYYRGRNVVELAETDSVESVAGLLWQADPSTLFTDRLPNPVPGQADLLKGLAFASPLDRAVAMLALLERSNPRAFDLSPAGFTQSGVDVVRWLIALLFDRDAPTAEPLHLAVARATGQSAEIADLVRRAMILVADQQFGDTTRAVRAAATTGITPYGVVIVGIIANNGPSIRFNRVDAVRRFILEVVTSDYPEEAVISRVRAGEKIPGFETLLFHETGDSRVDALLNASKRVFAGSPELERLTRALDLATDLTNREPSFVVPLVFLGHMLGMRGNELAIATIGRSLGWIAHAHEQMQQSPVRLPAAYIGDLPKPIL